MMNVRLKLREPEGLIVPEGPSFSSARIIKTTIDGTSISFKAPKHSPRKKSKPVLPDRIYDLEYTVFHGEKNKKFKAPWYWEYREIFDHAWAFCGPWFSGVSAQLWMFLRLLKPVDYPNQRLSLFHPRVFEQMVGDYLTFIYSDAVDDTSNKCYSIAPVDWQPCEHLPVVATKLKAISDPDISMLEPDNFLFFPIADDLMVSARFMPSQLLNLPQEERDRLVDTSTMLALMDKIVDSFHVELSPQALAQQQAALKGLKDTSLVKEYPPFDWNSREFRKRTFVDPDNIAND
jgi:hypothetical protein